MHALPDHSIEPFLMLADKSASCPTDGLNQKLRIRRDMDGRKGVVVSGELSPEDLSPPILAKVPVGVYVEKILKGEVPDFSEGFGNVVGNLAGAYERDVMIKPVPGGKCRDCEFRASPEDLERGMLCGFRQCWKEAFGMNDDDFGIPTLLDIWDFRKKDGYLSQGHWRMDSVTGEFKDLPSGSEPGLTRMQRQWTQILKTTSKDDNPYVDKEGLLNEMAGWRFPLHFIDFETSIPAIPFNRGRHPYEGIAFQFSHHVVEEDGSVRHEGQFIEAEPGAFPNYRFLRELKNQIEGDQGTIFRYASHENTFLRIILQQLNQDPCPPEDAREMIAFIENITEFKDERRRKIEGPRNMIDMLILVKRYYYDPAMGGSNSIKYVLPAILNSSPFLQRKYSQPIYGSPEGIPSLNYRDWAWVRYENGKVADPYRLLPAIFEGIDTERLDQFIAREDQEIREGGAAMMAWSLMQFSEMSGLERQKTTEALLKYCELDTLAMVMIWEGWREMLA